MPASAFALLGVFILLAIGVGVAAAWIVGPRRPLAAIVLPVAGRVRGPVLRGSPQRTAAWPDASSLFGYQVAIVQDVVVAVVAAAVAAVIQRAIVAPCGAGRAGHGQPRRLTHARRPAPRGRATCA